MNNIIKIFYGTLIEPVNTFRNIGEIKNYKIPFFILCLISLFTLLLIQNVLPTDFISIYITNTVNLIIYWVFLTFFIDLIAKTFTQKSEYSRLLSLLSFSLIPLIFIAPLKLLKNSFGIFINIADILLICVWIWTICLQVIAISEAYNIPRGNAIWVLFIPFIGTILYIIWTIDFFSKIFQFAAL